MKKILIALIGVSLLSACAQKPYGSSGTSSAPAQAYVKLGKPYTVRGVTYVPAHQPSYREEGLASWYGPGFHGKSTASGETFNKWDLTVAHPTLPMPSLVRITHLKTGKQIVARVNDRGPFSRGRIVDLSRRTAEELGTIGEGIARVRVEFLPEETDKMMQLVNSGRRPFEIDIAREVLEPVRLARKDAGAAYTTNTRTHDRRSIWEKMSVVSSAQASEPPKSVQPHVTNSAAPMVEVAQHDLQPPQTLKSSELPPLSVPARPSYSKSIYDVLPPENVVTPPKKIKEPADHPDLTKHTDGYFVRLATFSDKVRAESLVKTFAPHDLIIEPMEVSGRTLYRTRIGPIATKSEADRMIAKAYASGLKDAFIVRVTK